jgi:hypothetical protein
MAFTGQVSVTGVVLMDDHVPLVRDERLEWELPGGSSSGIDTACGSGSRMVKTVRSVSEQR